MKKTIILLFMATVIASGCKKYLDVNTNPNQPTVVTPNVVLSAALTGSAANLGTDFLSVNRYMGYWSRSGNYVSDPVNEQYEFNNAQTDGEWQNLYTTLNRYKYIEAQGIANGQPFYTGVAKTMEALHFSTLVDVYGNVPYSQAFDPINHVQPKYDDAATIYTELIAKLDSAVTLFQAATTYYTTAPKTQVTTDDQYDLIFGRGKGVAPATRMTEWIEFANTIKLKLLLHEYQVVTSSYVNAEIAKATASGGYLPAGTSAAVNPGYLNDVNKQNPFYAIFQTPTAANVNQGFFRANTYAINFFESTGDEREDFYYGTPYTNQELVIGNYDGDPASLTNSVVAQVGGDGDQAVFGVTLPNAGTLKSSSQDQLILSDFESLFIQAEAAARGWITGADSVYYREAVEQNFVYLNANLFVGQGYINPAYATQDGPVGEADYYIQGTTNPDPDPNWGYGMLTAVASNKYLVFPTPSTMAGDLSVIMTQKWAALDGINWVEAWTDYRRTGFPSSDVLGISKATTHVKNEIPIRYLYPQTELNTNPQNVPSLPAPAQYDPIFWDK